MICTSDQVWQFKLNNGNVEEMVIIDPLLDTEARAEERAMSEFLRNGYGSNSPTFNTFITDLTINDCISFNGSHFLIKGISIKATSSSIIASIEVTRYD